MLIKVNTQTAPAYESVNPLEQYDSIISEQAAQNKLDHSPLSWRQLKTLAETYEDHGVKVEVKITDDKFEITFRRHAKKTTGQFSRNKLPFELQARAVLDNMGESVKG
jgi:hypothetical protein